MLIQRAYKTELDPNETQVRAMIRHAGAARFVWNWGLARRRETYEQTGESPRAYTQQKEWTQWKAQAGNEWTYECNNSVYQSALQDLDKAYDNFFRRVKQGNGKPGFPRFKSRKWGIGTFRLYGSIRAEHQRVRLPTVGWVRLHERGYLPTSGVKVLNVTVSEQAGRWYVSFQVEEEVPEAPQGTGAPIGVDLGISHLATVADDAGNVREYENPKAVVRYERKLARLQRKIARQKGSKKGERNSNRRLRTKKRIAKLHRRIANVRGNAIHEMTTGLVAKGKPPDQRPSVIVLEDLNVSGMLKNRRLARAVSDASFREARRQLEYKAEWYGSRVLLADQWFPSSKRCADCGAVNALLKLSDRRWVCPACGVVNERDANAAVNLAQLASKSGESQNGRGGGSAGDGDSAVVKLPPVKRQAGMLPAESASAEQSLQPVGGV